MLDGWGRVDSLSADGPGHTDSCGLVIEGMQIIDVIHQVLQLNRRYL